MKMIKIISLIALLCIIYNNVSYSQYIHTDKPNIKKDLELKIFNDTTVKSKDTKIESSSSEKKPAIAFLLSLLLPGAGHWYADRLDVGKYFFASEAASWLGVIGFDLYGNALRDDSRSFATVHAGLNKNGKDDNYFSNVGNFNNIYSYNNDKLSKGQYDQLYDVNTFFWSWDNSSSMAIFENQRKKSERVYNDRIIFATALVINRIVSGISAILITNKGNKNESGSFRIDSELLRNNRNTIDGLKLNFIRNF